MTEDEAKQYVDAAPDALEKRLRMLEVGLLRQTAALEQMREAIKRLAQKSAVYR